MRAWWSEIHRVCKPSAVLISFGAQPFTTDLIVSNRRNFRYSLVWQKTNAVGFLSANVRPLRSHEDILIFCQRFGRVQGEMQSVYNPQMQIGKPYTHRSRSRPAAHYSSLKDIGDYDNPGTRYPTSVLTFPRDTPSLHPTAKPVALLSWLIRTYSLPGQTVLDPFAGNGSTGAACAIDGRKFIGIELDPDYYAVAAKRLGLTDGGQR